MILYSLICDSDHDFEVWFKSSGDFEDQSNKGYISCPICGSEAVSKSLMAPSISTSRSRQDRITAADDAAGPSPDASGAVPDTNPAMMLQPQMALSNPDPKMTALLDAMRKLKNHVTENADYVGKDFAEEARKIHYGESEERGIYGETTPQEAEGLREEGIEVQPLPVLPDETN